MPAINLEELDLKANLGAFSTYDMETLVPAVQAIKPSGVYVEIGVDRGKSLSVARMVSDPTVEVYGVDLIDPPIKEVEGAVFIQGDSATIASTWTKTVDVIFIDGNHSYEGCKADIDAWLPHMAKNGVMLFHDCDANGPGVERAVKELGEQVKKTVWYDPNPRCGMAKVEL